MRVEVEERFDAILAVMDGIPPHNPVLPETLNAVPEGETTLDMRPRNRRIFGRSRRVDMDQLKRQAAAQALAHVRDGMKVGLGTGSTAKHFVDLLGE